MRVSLKEKLKNQLSSQALEEVSNSFDLIGEIAIVKAPSNPADAQIVARHIMTTHRKIRAVYSQTSPVEGSHRTRQLTLLTGENISLTTYKEAGCVFLVDVAKCYFSPRLSYERHRIATQVQPGEVVVNMFAGVGCFSIQVAKNTFNSKVYSIDVNPVAYQFMVENVQFNNVSSRVVSLLGDSKEVVENGLQGVADRVLMPLPEKALEYLPTALSALKKAGGWIHYYDFEHAQGREDPRDKTKQKVAANLEALGVDYTFGCSRIIRSTGPNWYQTVLDIQVAACSNKF